MFLAHHQASEVLQLAIGPLDFPAAAVTAQLAAVLPRCSTAVATMRADEVDAPLRQAFAQRITLPHLVLPTEAPPFCPGKRAVCRGLAHIDFAEPSVC